MLERNFSVLCAIMLALTFAAATASAQEQRINVRGTIEKVDGQIMIVRSRDGSELTVKLADNVTVRGLIKAPLSDVKIGTYVGVSAMPLADGTQRAMHVHIFPEPMRGVAEGFQPFDLRPGSTMTNATVDASVTGTDGQVLKLKYKDGEKTIIVPADAPIVAYVPGSKDDLKPGAKIMIFNAVKQPDSTLRAASVNVGRDGVTPPM
jgi:hypothetical protein